MFLPRLKKKVVEAERFGMMFGYLILQTWVNLLCNHGNHLYWRKFFMNHAIVGIIAISLAVWGLVVWWTTFGMVMRGLAPICLLTFGLISIVYGLRKLWSSKNEVSK